MERDDEAKAALDQALSAGDDWLRKQGVITDFSINTIIASTYINFPQVENVELDIDKVNSRIYMRVYCTLWAIILMMLFRRRERFVDSIFMWIQEYLPTYEISVELKRWKGHSEKFTIRSNAPVKEEPEELDGNVAEALKTQKNKPT